MKTLKKDRSIYFSENHYLIIMISTFIFFLTTDVLINLQYFNPLIRLDSGLLYTILSLISSISLIGMTFLSIIISNSNELYIGMNITEFITIVQPTYFTIKNVIAFQLSLILLSSILLSVNFVNSFNSLFFISLLLIWIMTEKVFSINFRLTNIKNDIVTYYQEIITSNTDEKIELKKKIIINLITYGNENLNIPMQEVHLLDELIIQAVEESKNIDKKLSEELLCLIEKEYTTFISKRILYNNSQSLLYDYNSLIKVYRAFNNIHEEINIFYNIYSVYYTSLKKITIEAIQISDFSFYELYDVLKNNYLLSKNSSVINFKKDYISRFHSDNYSNFYCKHIDYFDLRIKELTNISTYNNNFDLVDYTTILNLFKEMLAIGHSHNFERYFNILLDKNKDYYETDNKGIHDSLVMYLLLYLNYLSQFKDGSSAEQINSAKEYLSNNIEKVKEYVVTFNIYPLLKERAYKEFILDDFKWLVFDENGVSMGRPLSTFVEVYLLWLLNINERIHNPSEHTKLLLDNFEDPSIIDDDQNNTGYFQQLNNTFGISSKSPEKMSQDLKRFSDDWFREKTLELVGKKGQTELEFNILLESDETYKIYKNDKCDNVTSNSKSFNFNIVQSTTSPMHSTSYDYFKEEIGKQYIEKVYLEEILTNSDNYNEQTSRLDSFSEKYNEIIQNYENESDILIIGSTEFLEKVRREKLYSIIKPLMTKFKTIRGTNLQDKLLISDKNKVHFKILNLVIMKDKSEDRFKKFLKAHESSGDYTIEYSDGREYNYSTEEMRIIFNKYDFTYSVKIEYEFKIIVEESLVSLELTD